MVEKRTTPTLGDANLNTTNTTGGGLAAATNNPTKAIRQVGAATATGTVAYIGTYSADADL